MPREEVAELQLRRLEAAPRRRQVRRVRRDRHRQPGEERHPVERDHELARRRDRHAEPLGAHARQHAASHKVLLLGGPNTYLPFLQECWRLRIPETWDERGYDYPKDVPIEELIFVPKNAQYYAAFGAVLYGLYEAATVGVYRGLDAARRVHRRTAARRSSARRAGPPLVEADERARRVPRAVQDPEVRRRRRSSPAQIVRGVIGLDGGSTSSKAVLIDEDGEHPARRPTSSPRATRSRTRRSSSRSCKQWVDRPGRDARGHGLRRHRLRGRRARGVACSADVNIVETVAHMMSADALLRRRRRHLRHRRAGHQGPVHAERRHQELPPVELSARPATACCCRRWPISSACRSPSTPTSRSRRELAPKFSYGCAVFLDTDRVNFQKEGYSKEELLAGLAQVLPKNVWQYVVQIPRMAALGTQVRAPGRHAVQPRRASRRRSTTSRSASRTPRSTCTRTRGEAGAIGAAFETLRVVKRRGTTTFIGLDAGDRPRVHVDERRGDALPLLPERLHAHVHRHARRPTARPRATSAGFSCEKGTVESEGGDARAHRKERKKRMKQFPNLVDYEAKLRVPALLRAGADARATARRSKDVEVKKRHLRRQDASQIDAAVPALERRGVGEAPRASASASRAC